MDEDLPKKRIGFCRNAARKLLQEYIDSCGNFSLPVPADKIAEFLGFEVHLLDNLEKEHSAIVDRENKLIGLNKKHHRVRQRFSIGHELGHIRLCHPPEYESSKEEIRLYNSEADTFAAEFLMPLDRLQEEIKKGLNFEQLADIFHVSTQAISIKVIEQNLLNKM